MTFAIVFICCSRLTPLTLCNTMNVNREVLSLGDTMKKSLTEITQILKAQKPYLAERYGVLEIGVFGSWVRDEQHGESDIDILVDLGEIPRIDLFDLVNLERYLSDLLDGRVDVAVRSSLRKRIGQRILKEVVPV